MSKTDNQIPLLDLKSQFAFLKDELTEAFFEVMYSGQYILGNKVAEFEKAVADYCGTTEAVGVANGTDALLLSLKALGIGPGDEVITTPFTFFATAEVISLLGAKPVFVDICPQTYNIDVSKIEAAITPNTKAILPVHLFGQPADMEEILKIASLHKLFVIEDACQAIGSEYQSQKAGSFGIAGCFSFFPTKNLGGYGDGGMIVTSDTEFADRIRILRVHGSNLKYFHSMIGQNSRLDTLQAAMLSVKLKYLDTWNKQRREKANKYTSFLSNTPLSLPQQAENRTHVFHLYVVQADDRDQLMSYLKSKGIATAIYYPLPLHRQAVYLHLNYPEGSFPVAEYVARRIFALPLYPELCEEDQATVIAEIQNFYSSRW